MSVSSMLYAYSSAPGGGSWLTPRVEVTAELELPLRSGLPLDLAARLKSEVDLPCRGFGLRGRLLSPTRELIETLKGVRDRPVFIWGRRYRLLSVNDDGTFEAAEW